MKWLLLIALALPLAVAQECLHYTDCQPAHCAGSARYCIDQSCIYSDCVTDEAKTQGIRDNIPSFTEIMGPYKLGAGESFGIKAILIIILKAALLAVIAVILILLLSLSAFPKAVNIAVIVFFIMLEIFMGILLFKGTGFFSFIFGTEELTWENVPPDHFVPASMTQRSLEKRDFNSAQIEGISSYVVAGQEFKASDFDEEIKLVILQLDSVQNMQRVDLKPGLTRLESVDTLSGEKILVHQRTGYKTLVWDEDRFIFILTAANTTADRIAIRIISQYPSEMTLSSLFPNDIRPPAVMNIFPANDTLMRSKLLSFEVIDRDSPIANISIEGIAGFDMGKCTMHDRSASCSFAPEPQQGMNRFIIEASDSYGNSNRTASSFIYDREPWHLLSLKPIPGSITNNPGISFRMTDNYSGIDIYSLKIEGINATAKNCNAVASGYECSFYDHNLSEGMHNIVVNAQDNSGNTAEHPFWFIYDSTEPTVQIISASRFTIYDEIGINNQSARVNKRYFDLADCSLDKMTYDCRSSQVFEVEVWDLAGNGQTEVSTLTR